MTPQEQFLVQARDGAVAAGHLFPEYAACEAALESGWGQSLLATQANNLFGEKQSNPPVPGTSTLALPTREFIRGSWVTVPANWAKFADVQSCFAARMATLKRLAPGYPHYAAALAAKSGEEFVIEVSKTWSTDPARAGKVLSIYDAHCSVFAAPPAASTAGSEGSPAGNPEPATA